MSEKNITAATGKTLDLVPAAAGDVPEILDQLIAAAPGPLQAPLREALKKAAFLNPGDPVFELVLVLELIGVYYQRIAARVTKAGADMDAKNTAALVSLDDRVRKLQGLGQIIQQATDRLETIAPDIVERFPVEWIVKQVVEKTDARIKALPLEAFQAKTAEAHATIDTLSRSVNISANALTNAANEIDAASKKIKNANLPSVSVAWAAFWLAIGAILASAIIVGLTSWFVPDGRRVTGWLKYDQGKTLLVVPGHEYSDVSRDTGTKAITFELKP